MKKQTIIRYVLAATAVIILGALAGWVFFLRSQTGATAALGAGRGFGTQVPAGAGFGGAGNTPSSASGGLGGSAATSTSTPPQLWHVTPAPSGGIGFATSTSGSHLRYAERATGYIFEADPVNGGIARLTNSLMPKIYAADFAPGRVLERSLDADGAITTFAGLITMSSSSALTGVSLPKGILAVAPDPKSSQLFYLQSRGSGVTGMTSAWNGSKPQQVFSSALPGWRVWWLADGRIMLAQKASDSLAGYAYTLTKGVLNPLIGPLPGLSILPRTNSSALLYSTSSGGAPALFVRVSATTTVVRLAIATVADKCVWAGGSALIAYCAVPQSPLPAGFLDAWYRGEIHPSDAIWRVDVSAGKAELIFTPASNTPLDVTVPITDDTGAYIAFMNAVDGSPWLLRLNK